MGKDDHGFLVRIPPVLWAELEERHWTERRNITDLILEGVAIRLHAVPDGWLDFLLEQAGYQPKSKPGRPRKTPAAANGQAPSAPAPGTLPGPAGVADDAWTLDGDR